MDLEKREITSSAIFTPHAHVPSNEDTQGIHLSNLEFDLLKYFAQNKDKVITRQELYEKVWGEFE